MNRFSCLLLLTILACTVSTLHAEAPNDTAKPHRTPQQGLSALDVGEGLEATIFAAEPMMLSPTNIDIDYRGRVWVCEVVNYRHDRNQDNPLREKGDRILILEDTNGDGKADRKKVFYQGRDIDSAHGICVLGTPDGQTALTVTSCSANSTATDSTRPMRPNLDAA